MRGAYVFCELVSKLADEMADPADFVRGGRGAVGRRRHVRVVLFDSSLYRLDHRDVGVLGRGREEHPRSARPVVPIGYRLPVLEKICPRRISCQTPVAGDAAKDAEQRLIVLETLVPESSVVLVLQAEQHVGARADERSDDSDRTTDYRCEKADEDGHPCIVWPSRQKC